MSYNIDSNNEKLFICLLSKTGLIFQETDRPNNRTWRAFPRASTVLFSRRHFCYHRPSIVTGAAPFNGGGRRGERIARSERACRPQLLFSIGFFLLSLRGETLEPGDWPFPRQTAQLRCTIIYLASSRARCALAIVRPLCHAVGRLRRRWNEDGERKSERSVRFNRSHRALSRKPFVRNCRYFFPDDRQFAINRRKRYAWLIGAAIIPPLVNWFISGIARRINRKVSASPYFIIQLSVVSLRCFIGIANISIARPHKRRNTIYWFSFSVLKNWLRSAVRAITGKFTFYDSFVIKRSALRLFCNLLSNLNSCIFIMLFITALFFYIKCFYRHFDRRPRFLFFPLFSTSEDWLTYHDYALFFRWTYSECFNLHITLSFIKRTVLKKKFILKHRFTKIFLNVNLIDKRHFAFYKIIFIRNFSIRIQMTYTKRIVFLEWTFSSGLWGYKTAISLWPFIHVETNNIGMERESPSRGLGYCRRWLIGVARTH